MMPARTPDEQRKHLYATVFALCKEIGLYEDERHEWLERITGIDGGSMTRADLGQLRVFVTQLRGAQTFCELMILRYDEKAVAGH
jgi:hypothetical protein